MRKNFRKDLEILNNLDKKRFLITGGYGMLANSFLKQLKKYTKKTKIYYLSKNSLNVSKKNSFRRFTKLKPDYIIHCAALVNADLCEKKKRLAKENIFNGTKNIIQFAKKNKSKIFYPQSFLIYKSSNKKVDENTLPKPLSVYGKYKLKSEQFLLKSYKNSLIVRMGGFFGGEKIDNNFVGKITQHISKLIKSGIKELEIGDRIWQPTYTDDLAYNSLILLAKKKDGVYNMASIGSCSFFTLTKKIIEYLKLSKKIRIKKISAKILNKKEFAKRPSILIMNNKRLIKEGLNRQRNWKLSLKEYLSQRYFKDLYK